MVVLALTLGLAVGALAAWLVARARMSRLELELEHEREGGAEKVALLRQAKDDLSASFRAASADALRETNASFLQLAKSEFAQLQTRATEDLGRRQQAVEHLVKPIRESLERVGQEVKTLEHSRRQDYGSLSAQLRTLAETSERLRAETGTLVTALRAPAVRGRWGEMQLRNAVEAAGMLNYCDFHEQVTARTDDGLLRPDLVVRLPGGHNLVVDAKAPLQALLDAIDSRDDDARAASMQDFVRHVRDHVAKLSAKAYWAQFSPTPDFVIMFLPGENFYRAALELDPSLLELRTNQRVVIASPSTLIALLQAVAVGWREERVAESARTVNELGRELYDRLATMTDHVVTLGRRLDGAVQAYNQTVGSFERRVLVSARRFTEHGVSSPKELASPSPIERSAQPPQTVELTPRVAAEDPPEQPALGAADAA
jgi:DNA recombination protein RmuC